MNVKNDTYFKKLIKERGLSPSSQENYYYALSKYSTLNDLTLTELIEEADQEEEDQIRMKRRKIKTRLIEYQTYLKSQEYSKTYIKGNITLVKIFYGHYEIETPKLPPLNLKTTYHERYEDIPTKKQIQEALETAPKIMHKAMILFMISSGSSRMETTMLKVNDFIDATKDYHSNGSIRNILNELENQDDIIPLFKMTRAKTDYPYYTCCSPEASSMIVRHLKKEKSVRLNDRIFKLDLDSVSRFFSRINDKNGWGKKGNGFRLFHPHALRKFNTTAIEDMGFANTIQGRRPDPITEAYFKHNPKRIKEKYLEHLPKLTINETIVNKVDDEGTKQIKKLEKENKALKEKQTKTDERIAKIEEEKDSDLVWIRNIRKKYGENVIEKMVKGENL